MNKIVVVKVVAYTIAAIAAVSSYAHQVALLTLADLDPLFGIVPSEWVTPATVDALAFIALVVRTSDAEAALKRAAMLPLVLAGGMSVAANVATAHNVIQVVVGVWTVAAYIVAELFVSRLNKPAPAGAVVNVTPVAVPQPPAPATMTYVTPPAPKATGTRKCGRDCTCGKHRSRNALRAIETSYAMPAAPVSGA